MEEKIQAGEGLLKEMQGEAYTPYRDMCIGALRTFLENAKQHARALALRAEGTLADRNVRAPISAPK